MDFRKPENPIRIGPALINAGVIDESQLEASLREQKRYPQFTIGQLISFMHDVPMEIIDEVNIRYIVLPYFPDVFVRRLQHVADSDRFAGNLKLEKWITGFTAEPVHYASVTVDTRNYGRTNGKLIREKNDRYVLSEVRIEVNIITAGADSISGEVNITHDTRTKKVVLVEQDHELKGSLYYGLRASFAKTE